MVYESSAFVVSAYLYDEGTKSKEEWIESAKETTGDTLHFFN